MSHVMRQYAVKESLLNTIKASMEQSLTFCNSAPKRVNIFILFFIKIIFSLLGPLWQKGRDCSIAAFTVFDSLSLTASYSITCDLDSKEKPKVQFFAEKWIQFCSTKQVWVSCEKCTFLCITGGGMTALPDRFHIKLKNLNDYFLH